MSLPSTSCLLHLHYEIHVKYILIFTSIESFYVAQNVLNHLTQCLHPIQKLLKVYLSVLSNVYLFHQHLALNALHLIYVLNLPLFRLRKHVHLLIYSFIPEFDIHTFEYFIYLEKTKIKRRG